MNTCLVGARPELPKPHLCNASTGVAPHPHKVLAEKFHKKSIREENAKKKRAHDEHHAVGTKSSVLKILI